MECGAIILLNCFDPNQHLLLLSTRVTAVYIVWFVAYSLLMFPLNFTVSSSGNYMLHFVQLPVSREDKRIVYFISED